MKLISLRVFTAAIPAPIAVACVPRAVDPKFSDSNSDGDGRIDARDHCMAGLSVRNATQRSASEFFGGKERSAARYLYRVVAP